jgi:Ca2+-binding RTX toxin-like protein
MATFNGTENNDTLTGTDTDDTIYGNGGKDSIRGKLGNDILYGGAGADTYFFAKNDGVDYINNYDTDGSVDVVEFSNLASTGVTAVFDSANDLVLQYGGGSQLTVENYFTSDANYRIDKFQFTDLSWNLAKLAGMHNGTAVGDTLYGFNGVVNVINGLGGNDGIYGGDLNDKLNGGEGSDIIYGYNGNDTITGDVGDDNLQGMEGNDIITAGDGNDSLIGSNGNDELTGGLGNDSMQGNNGIDTYLIAKADGVDYINNYDTDGNLDTVKFTNLASTGITAVFDSANDLVLQYAGGSQLTIENYFTSDINYRVDKIIFTDATWTVNQIAPKHNGTSNADTLYGFNGIANTINGLEGNDAIYGGDLNDKLNGNEGSDLIYGYAGNDTITGDIGDDNLQGMDGDDSITAGDGNDALYGGNGNDALIGGLANDSMQGNNGADVYTIAKLDGQDIINNYDTDASVDVVKFSNVASKDIKAVYDSGYNLVFEYGTSSKLEIYYYFTSDANYRVDKFQFSDGVNWTINNIAPKHNGTDNADTLYGFNGLANTINGLGGNDAIYGGDLNDTLNGNDGNDTIQGNAGNDTITGGTGNDSMQGNAGVDVYNVSKTDGEDIIYNYDTDGSIDTVKFSNVKSTDIKAVYDSGYNLVLEYGAGNKLQVYYYFTSDANYRVDKFQFSDGINWTINNIAPKHNGTANGDTLYGFNGLANTINGLGGNDAIYGGDLNDTLNGDDGNDTIQGNAGNDTIVGGLANDSLQGNAGNDVYTIAKVDGQDIIYNYDTDGSVDVVKFTNVASTDIKAVFDSGYNLVLQYGTSSQLTVYYYFTSDVNYRIDKFQFTDKTWTLADLAPQHNGTGNADTLYGFNGIANTINGLGGNDAIYGGDLGDKLYGGDGNDSIVGYAGNDLLVGGQGNDTLQGDAGVDTYGLIGTDGVDTINNYDTDGSADVVSLTDVGLLDLNGISIAAGNGLTVAYGDVGSQFTVNYHFVNSSYQINELQLLGGDKLKGFIIGTTAGDTLVGTSLNEALSGLAGNDTLRGGGGDDLYFIDDAGDKITENVGAGVDTVLATVNYTLADNVDNLALKTGAVTGTGNALDNELMGNSAANTLSGLAGNDWLDGGAKGDTMNGGAGNDTFIVDNIADSIVEAAGQGNDSVQSSVTFTLSANVENLLLTKASAINGTGNDIANRLTGNTGVNVLDGAAGDDVLDGDAGADTLKGGTGNDTFIIDVADTIEEGVGAGTDTVQSNFTYTLGANLENLILTGAGAINGTGNTLVNSITGNAGANTLNGGGAADFLSGKAGDDVYFVDVAGDVVDEAAGAGSDTVNSAINYTLGDNLENLTLIGAAINATGNALANKLTGNVSNNLLNGGVEADEMTGGAGNDSYIVDNIADTIIELAGGGTDSVESSVSFTLSDQVENLTLTGSAGLKATGNNIANILIGNSGGNSINGGGSADTMRGGDGNDTYFAGSSTDVVEELANQGVDLVISSASFTLSGDVENLTLIGTADINGFGNNLNNILIGNAAINILDGADGADKLTGGAGADVFVFSSLLGGTDITLDYLSGTDKVQVSGAIDIGNGDAVVDLGTAVDAGGTFTAQAELVIINTNIVGAIDRVAAASAIGSAQSAYAVGDSRLFVVDNGTDSILYQFKSAAADAAVDAEELTLVGSLQGTAQTVVADYLFA